MMGAVETIVLVTDANVLINFCNIQRLDLLGGLPGYRFIVPAEVFAEITDAAQREQVEAAFLSGCLTQATITDPSELEAYAEFVSFAGKGEAACLAIAVNRGYTVASDDRRRKFFREVTRRLGSGRIIGTVEIAREAIRSGLVTLAEADGWIDVWRSRRFEPATQSFKSGSIGT